MPVMGSLGFANTTYGDADFTIVGILFGNLAQVVTGAPLVVVCVALFLVPIVYALVAPSHDKDEDSVGEKDAGEKGTGSTAR